MFEWWNCLRVNRKQVWRVLTFQDDDDLQVLGHQRLCRQLVQRTPSLHGVADDQRRNQEDAVAPQWVLHLDVQLGHRDDLALRRHRAPDHLNGETSPVSVQTDWEKNSFDFYLSVSMMQTFRSTRSFLCD